MVGFEFGESHRRLLDYQGRPFIHETNDFQGHGAGRAIGTEPAGGKLV